MTKLDFPPTHIQYLNGDIHPWRHYLIPERTWLALHDALHHGSWSEHWLRQMPQSQQHPDLPTIAEINAQLMDTGISQATLRELVYLVAALAVAVEDEAQGMKHVRDIAIEGYEPFRPYLSGYNPDDDEEEDEPFTMPIIRTVQAKREGVPTQVMVVWMAWVLALLVMIFLR
jgi:hypothetical protein